MPELSQDYKTNYSGFVGLFVMMTICRLISYINLILRISSIDLFFIDWEKPKYFEENASAKISVWRNLFIANEFNELSNWRYVVDEVTIIWFAFFSLGLGWQETAR